MNSVLYVALIWHHHQPTYKHPESGKYMLPWTRMHAVKDYFYMANLLAYFPRVNYTVNITPVLISQLNDYIYYYASDLYLDVTNKPVEELTPEDKRLIIENSFVLNPEYFIKPYPAFYSLYRKVNSLGMERAIEELTDQDFLDLQVWGNLVWFDPHFRRDDPVVKRLISEGHFTERHKSLLVRKQLEVMSLTLLRYNELVDLGQAEIITSPFYHPILPLLIDRDVARETGINSLPELKFSYPGDARLQLESGIDLYKSSFGSRPSGIWPSELAVSNDALNIIKSSGINWVIADEDILAKTFGKNLRDNECRLINPELLYRPYLVNTSSGKITMVFRDKLLSNLISFDYPRWNSQNAAIDLIRRLEEIRFSLPSDKKYLVVIALDGENCWSYYPENGWEFLVSLYERLSSTAGLKAVTVSNFMEIDNNYDVLNGISPGSWINMSFDTWIGQPATNKAWDYLTRVRQDLEDYRDKIDEKSYESALRELLIAEGSDWFWWYNRYHNVKEDKLFDELFRAHLREVYKRINKQIPDFLYNSIEKS
ncbi:MAG TPA: glycoside hydrolase family 57 protein [bacterium]|mgnify:FL=1|nr:glycoside hydrolase family 57 protein [bacterium]